MKKQLVTSAVVSLVLVSGICFAGCSSSSNSSETSNSSTSAEPAQQAASNSEASKYTVSIDDCVLTTDYEGKSAIVVTYTWTNNSDDAQMFSVAINAQAFQNGVQLSSAVISSGDFDFESALKEIKSGATQTVQLAYALDDQSEVSVECTELISLSDEVLAQKTFQVA